MRMTMLAFLLRSGCVQQAPPTGNGEQTATPVPPTSTQQTQAGTRPTATTRSTGQPPTGISSLDKALALAPTDTLTIVFTDWALLKQIGGFPGLNSTHSYE